MASLKGIGRVMGRVGAGTVGFITSGSIDQAIEDSRDGARMGASIGEDAGKIYDNYVAPALDWVFGTEDDAEAPQAPITALQLAVINATHNQFKKAVRQQFEFGIDTNPLMIQMAVIEEVANWYNHIGSPLTPQQSQEVQDYAVLIFSTRRDELNYIINSVRIVSVAARSAQSSAQGAANASALERSRMMAEYYQGKSGDAQSSAQDAANATALERSKMMAAAEAKKKNPALPIIALAIASKLF